MCETDKADENKLSEFFIFWGRCFRLDIFRAVIPNACVSVITMLTIWLIISIRTGRERAEFAQQGAAACSGHYAVVQIIFSKLPFQK